jgi:hypothetical protein
MISLYHLIPEKTNRSCNNGKREGKLLGRDIKEGRKLALSIFGGGYHSFVEVPPWFSNYGKPRPQLLPMIKANLKLLTNKA